MSWNEESGEGRRGNGGAFRPEDFGKVESVEMVFLSNGILGPPEKTGGGEGNLDPVNGPPADLALSQFVGDPAGFRQQVNRQFVADSDHGVFRDFIRLDLGGSLVWQNHQGFQDARTVFPGSFNQEVDILGRTGVSGLEDGKTTDDDIPRPKFVQLPADFDEVGLLRRSRLR